MKGSAAALAILLATTTPLQAAIITTGTINVSGKDLVFNMLGGFGVSFKSIWDAAGNPSNGLSGGTTTSSPYFWDNQPGAEAARDALMAYYGTEDNTWDGTNDGFLIPYEATSTTTVAAAFDSNSNPNTDDGRIATNWNSEISPPAFFAWVDFTEAAPASVPEPSTALPVALAGLMIPFAYRRRKQQRVARQPG